MISSSVISFVDKFRGLCPCGSQTLELMSALAEVAYPDECRRNPDAYPSCEDPRGRRPRRIGEMQRERNGDQRKRDRSHQGRHAPAQAREIEEPEERPHAPVKRRLPEEVANHQRNEMAMCEIEEQRAEREVQA